MPGPLGLPPLGEPSGNPESVFSQAGLTSSKDEEPAAKDLVTYEMKTTEEKEALGTQQPPPLEAMFNFKLPGLGS